jgi:hypothetical protein
MENSDPDGKSAPTPNQTVASKFEIHLTCMEMIGHLGGHLQAVLCRNAAVPQLAVECSVLPCVQQVAFLDTETGETGVRRLNHSDGEAERFYRDLQRRQAKVRVGIEATGHARWFDLFGCCGQKPGQGKVPADLTLASAFSFCFQ